MYHNTTTGKRKVNDKPVAPTTSKKQYSVARECAKIWDIDEESLLGNDFDLSGLDGGYSKRSIRCCEPEMTNPRPASVKITQMTIMHQKLTVSDTKAFFGVHLSMKHDVIKRRYELYFGKNCGFLLIRLVISVITRRARSSGFWCCSYRNSGLSEGE